MNLAEIVTLVRDFIDEETAAAWTDKRIARHVNVRLREIANELTAMGRGYFMRTASYDFVANQSQYSLPSDCVKIVRLERVDGSSPVEVWPISLAEAWQYRDRLDVDPQGSADAYALFGRKFIYVPTPTSATAAALTLYYTKRHPRLHTGTATAGSTTSITFPAASALTTGNMDLVTDAYEGCSVEITAGTGSAQIAGITAFNKSTRVATAAFSVAPDNTSVYALVSEVPEEFHEVAAYGAAIDCLLSTNDDVTELVAERNALYQLMVKDLAVPQIQKPDRVIYVPE